MTQKDIDHLVNTLEKLPNDSGSIEKLKSLADLNNGETLQEFEYDKNLPGEGLKIVRRK